jgi:pimeloyl-ACP methyl ester carboxylesterase
MIESNGIKMRIAEKGDTGPLILLAHGWPESWYSWRHQLIALAEAGYRVVAPDMRGYGETDAPAAVGDYDIIQLVGDMVGILDALGEETAIMVGHDWGSIVAWHCSLMYPKRFTALIAMSVPYGGRPKQSPLAYWQNKFGDKFFYILYHNEPGVAETEYDSDPRGLLSRLYVSPKSPREAPTITDRQRSAGGWIGRLGAPKRLPVEVPTLFIAGEKDVVIAGATIEDLTNTMSRVVSDLRDVVLIPEIGHWVQQEAPERTNAAMLTFLRKL